MRENICVALGVVAVIGIIFCSIKLFAFGLIGIAAIKIFSDYDDELDMVDL